MLNLGGPFSWLSQFFEYSWHLVHWNFVTGQSSCMSLDNLINNINRNELLCQRKQDCSGVQCFSQNSFLRNFVSVFDIRFLLCTNLQPSSPILWLQLLGEEDPTNNNQRSVLLNRNVTQSGSLDFPVTSGDLTFGVYRFIANFSVSESGEDSTVAIAVSWNAWAVQARFKCEIYIQEECGRQHY